MRVMMSAAGSPASVSILRHLKNLGHEVIGLNASEDVAPLARNFCDEFFVAPRANHPDYIEFLCNRLARVDLFLPFIDEELFSIATNWEEIPPVLASRIALSEPSVVLACVDKCRFQVLCQQSDLPIAPRATSAPAFFKPRFGRGGKGVVHVCDSHMLESVANADGVLQQAIEGDEFTVDAIYNAHGEFVAASPRRRLSATGVSVLGEVVPDAQLEELAIKLGTRWHFRYAINFQAIRDKDGRDWIIELNPRLAGSAIFSAMAGCDPFAATIALWRNEPWKGAARRLRVARYWSEFVWEERQT